jgi:hypothetical protein
MPRKRSILVLLATMAGCGGGAAGPGLVHVDVPWDKPLRPAPTEPATMHWALAEVTDISLDGATIKGKFTRGMVSEGARIGIYLKAPEEPSPHYMWDETRELRAAEAQVVQVMGDTFEARILAHRTNTRISAGDRIIELVP